MSIGKTHKNRWKGKCLRCEQLSRGNSIILDVSYGEDKCKICKDHGAENFSVIRRATLNILKGDKKTKAGIKNKRSKAGWDRSYMLELLGVN